MNNVELELMGLFATVVEQGSFTGAAEVLGMPKSSVSQKISRLESQLGVRLLQRTTRRLSLTPQGELYVEHCQGLLALARSANLAMARLRSAPAGRARSMDRPHSVRNWRRRGEAEASTSRWPWAKEKRAGCWWFSVMG